MLAVILRRILFFIFVSALVAASACLPASMPLPPESSSTPLPPTATATATPIWFPPTATFTPLPTVTPGSIPTLDMQPRYGELVFRDDFQKSELWTLGRGPMGSIALGKGEISLVVTAERGYLVSHRQETALADYYLEITASPSICRGGDEYGLLVRAASTEDFFRFGLTCRGEARLDRVLGGQASSPHPAEPNGAVPPGAPSVTRLGVWALGKELRFYANNQFLFAANDSSLPSGGIGLYVRAIGSESVTVNFSDLVVFQAGR